MHTAKTGNQSVAWFDVHLGTCMNLGDSVFPVFPYKYASATEMAISIDFSLQVRFSL